jgi:hypothetical protein
VNANILQEMPGGVRNNEERLQNVPQHEHAAWPEEHPTFLLETYCDYRDARK